jgi:hypothetical protein
MSTSDPASCIADLEAALKDPSKLSVATSVVSVARRSVSASGLASLLADLPASTNGWVSTTDAVYAYREGRWVHVSGIGDKAALPTEAGCARVLTGELALDGATSLHLRQLGTGLTLFRIVEGKRPLNPTSEEVVTAEAVPVVTFSHVHVSTERTAGMKHLRYSVAWRSELQPGPDSVPVWRPWLARFCGWED